MSYCYKYERSLFDYEDFAPVRATHHPFIYDQSMDELTEARSRLRDMREKERTMARQKRREQRGKSEPRGDSFPGTADRPRERKQVLSSALKRIAKELKRRRTMEARASNVEAAQRALAMRRKSQFAQHPANEAHADEGPKALPSRRRRWAVPPTKIGSISQMTKRAQATRDTKGG